MVSEHYQSTKKRVDLRYSALPRWFLPLATAVCICSGGAWTAIKLGGLPDLSGIRDTIQNLESRSVPPRTTPRLLYGQHGEIVAGISDTVEDFGPVETPQPRFLLPSLLPGDTPLDRTMYLLLSVFIASAALTMVGRDNRLSFTHEGLTFPSGMMPELKLRRKRKWSDISALSLVVDPKAHTRHLKVYFQSGGKATIDIDALGEKNLENLLLGLDELAGQCAMSPELVALRHKMFNDQKSATNLWEEEMASHFAATNFVALSPGSLLQNGRFKVVMHAFSGGLSAVYLAEQSATTLDISGKPQGNVVVVKESVIPATTDESTREKAREMFKREAQLLMQLKHDRIAKVLDHFVENGRDYLVLEYIPGLTLRQYIRRNGPQSEQIVLGWSKQIAEILCYLHERQTPIIHRDITPDNLMLTPDGRLFMIDFGAANQFVGAATGTIVGKQLYISPEQFRGKAVPASDVYALGATMHYLLTGEEPEALSAANPKSVRAEVSGATSDLVSQCMQQDLTERVQTARDLLNALVQLSTVAAGEVISTKTGVSADDAATAADATVIKVRQYEGQV
ncbi:MAG: serine/threonine protein kinase [Candidatus Obscuribacterales bacterium]|nr:serine/threonine protein kinase [Candidatus Obscuribacterales bacterium]